MVYNVASAPQELQAACNCCCAELSLVLSADMGCPAGQHLQGQLMQSLLLCLLVRCLSTASKSSTLPEGDLTWQHHNKGSRPVALNVGRCLPEKLHKFAIFVPLQRARIPFYLA